MLPGWLKKLITPTGRTRQADDLSALAPAQRFYAIGDIHGRLDLLQTLLPALDDTCPLIFVGDYIDRGDYSAQVLHHLHHLSASSGGRVVCLKGNHEDMLLGFLDDPEKVARVWLHNGGQQTLASFGLASADLTNPEAVATQLQQAMGPSLLDWLRERPLIWTSGNVAVVHAALDPSRPVDKQQARTCLWGHQRFPEKRRKDGQWVIHGHTIVTDPQQENGVISIDTGAFATGQLTAAEIAAGSVRFISTGRNGVFSVDL
ncbi:metallophosphoesterase [Rhodobacteraceae bacterium KLH11]|nr:metallophosphoesterase [Rhodobacteraceae bacterium KLH11]